jgi:DNA-directed RNA polymerase specialized sigma24 family protein
VQSVFASLYRGLRQGYYDVPEGEVLWSLLLVIALNKVRAKGEYYRAAKRDIRRTYGGEWLNEKYLDMDWERDDSSRILKMTIDETIARLDPPHDEIACLRMEGHEVAEIAARVNRSKRTVERSLQTLRHQLGKCLGERDN